MKNIISKILIAIMVLAILSCAFIVAYGMIPGMKQVLKPLAEAAGQNIAARAQESDENESSASNSQDLQTTTEDAASTALSENTVAVNDEAAAAPDAYQVVEDKASEEASLEDNNSEEKTEEKKDEEQKNDDNSDASQTSSDQSANKSGSLSYDEMKRKSGTSEIKPKVVTVTDKNINEVLLGATIGETGQHLYFDTKLYPYYNMLEAREQILYRQIYANADAYNKEFCPILDKVTATEFDNILFCVLYDHPELFWLDFNSILLYGHNGYVIKVELDFYDQFKDIPAAREEFENKAVELAKGALEFKTDLEKEKYIHDLLADKLTYKHGPLDQSAYSSIVEDETVCAGYMKAMQYLMQKLYIPTFACYGNGGGERHGWNIVLIDGAFYNVDCTWDDLDPTVYYYFNVSDKMNGGHERLFYSKNLPPCNSNKVMLIKN